jgi:hypothetical protein
MAQGQDTQNVLMDLSMTMQRHDDALVALKDVPKILADLAKKVGVDTKSDKQKETTGLLNLSEEEDNNEDNVDIDIEADVNNIIGSNDNDSKKNQNIIYFFSE